MPRGFHGLELGMVFNRPKGTTDVNIWRDRVARFYNLRRQTLLLVVMCVAEVLARHISPLGNHVVLTLGTQIELHAMPLSRAMPVLNHLTRTQLDAIAVARHVAWLLWNTHADLFAANASLAMLVYAANLVRVEALDGGVRLV